MHLILDALPEVAVVVERSQFIQDHLVLSALKNLHLYDFWADQLFVFIDEIAQRGNSRVNCIAKVFFEFGVIVLELIPMPDGIGFFKLQVSE